MDAVPDVNRIPESTARQFELLLERSHRRLGQLKLKVKIALAFDEIKRVCHSHLVTQATANLGEQGFFPLHGTP